MSRIRDSLLARGIDVRQWLTFGVVVLLLMGVLAVAIPVPGTARVAMATVNALGGQETEEGTKQIIWVDLMGRREAIRVRAGHGCVKGALAEVSIQRTLVGGSTLSPGRKGCSLPESS